MRTTSSVESFNAVLNRSIEKRPNFFRLVLALQIHESRKADKMHYVATNCPSPCGHFRKKKKEDEEREQKIVKLTGDLNEGRLSTEGFMLEMAKDDNGIIDVSSISTIHI